MASNYRGLFDKNSLVYFFIYKFPGTFYNSFPVGLIWLELGKYLTKSKNFRSLSVLSLVWGIILSLILLLVEYMVVDRLGCCVDNDCYVMLIPLAFCIGALAVWYDLPGSLFNISLSWCKIMRNASTAIFCSHGAFLTMLSRKYMGSKNEISILENIKIFMGGILLSCATFCIIYYFSQKKWGQMLKVFF